MSKNILFIYPATNNESLGIEYLSGSLKRAGHNTDLILHYEKEKFFERRLIKKINNFKPDFICFSVVSIDYIWACGVSKFIKNFSDTKIIFGGIHPTSCPEEVMDNKFVDFIVLGEGDETIVELVENTKRTNIKNTWLKKDGKIIKNSLRPLIQNLDLLPFPDKELFYDNAPYLKDTYLCISGKGCPFNCSYCFNNCLKKLYKGDKWVRKRSVDNLIKELKWAKEKFNYKRISFMDDCFILDKEWLKEFIREYKKEVNVPFRAISHSTFIDEEVVNLLKEGGCFKIQLGAQTPVDKIRKEICKRNDTNEDIMKSVNLLKKAKIVTSVDNIFGLPSETKEDYKDGLEFYIDLKPHIYFIFWLQYYPNTEMVNIGKRYGTIDDEDLKRMIKGKISYGNKYLNSEFLKISRFLFWIPILPKRMSRFILRKNLYSKIFRLDIFNFIPLILPHFYSSDLILTLLREIRKTILWNIYAHKMTLEGKKIDMNLGNNISIKLYKNNSVNFGKTMKNKK